ncbi:hypothetical protein HHI36_017465, partial [Cryptolaemus montrouzieri]
MSERMDFYAGICMSLEEEEDRIEEIPIRPVLVHYDSPSYKIAKWLNKYYKEVTGLRTKLIIKNSRDLVDKIKNTQ